MERETYEDELREGKEMERETEREGGRERGDQLRVREMVR